MDFGKLRDIDSIDFSLPAVPKETADMLKATGKKNKAEIYVGCPVWGEKEWVGQLYPKGTKAKDFLLHYAKHFNSIELNGTGYNLPTEEQVKKWKADAPAGFKFCPKITQNISHFKRLIGTDELVDAFCNSVRHFGDNLGTVFMLMPPNYAPKSLPDLIKFIEKWPKDIPLAVELRHEGWYADKAVNDEIFNALKENNIAFIITDVSGRRDVLHMRLSNPVAFIRFEGNDMHPTDYTRMDDWADRIAGLDQQGLETAYFFLHTTTKHYNLELSIYMIEALNKRGYNLKAPQLVK